MPRALPLWSLSHLEGVDVPVAAEARGAPTGGKPQHGACLRPRSRGSRRGVTVPSRAFKLGVQSAGRRASQLCPRGTVGGRAHTTGRSHGMRPPTLKGELLPPPALHSSWTHGLLFC